MPNICMFAMRVKGDIEVRKEMERLWDYDNRKPGSPFFARFWPDYVMHGKRVSHINGTCAWSVLSCLIDGYPQEKSYKDDGCVTLMDACKRLNLEVEILSEESGMMFWEYFYCDTEGNLTEKGGEIILDVGENEHTDEWNEAFDAEYSEFIDNVLVFEKIKSR